MPLHLQELFFTWFLKRNKTEQVEGDPDHVSSNRWKNTWILLHTVILQVIYAAFSFIRAGLDQE